jgi:cobalt-zinc-cadmium resistance protein CzcA
VQNRKLRAEQAKELIRTGADLPKTSVSAEYGKFNSPLADDRLSVTQNFSLPTLYRRQSRQLGEEWKAALLETELKEAEIRKLTTGIFYELLLVAEKEALLGKMDSAYSAFLRVAALRLKAGETNVLEKASAENQLIRLRILKKSIKQERALLQQQFMLLLNTKEPRTPESPAFKLEAPLPDASTLMDHPLLKWQRQQEKAADAATLVEKAKLLPEISAGYNNLSIRDGARYNRGDRFQSFQLGVAIPVFAGSQKARIRSAKTFQRIAQNETEYRANAMQAEYTAALAQVKQYREIVADFEDGALKNALEITGTLNRQLQGGEINYLEWTVLNQQSLSTQLDYLDAVRNLNNSIIHLNYLLAQ